jgi:hypothetical protein
LGAIKASAITSKSLEHQMPIFSPSGQKYHGKNPSSRKRGPGRYNRLRAYSRGKHGEMKAAGYPNGIEANAQWDASGNSKRLSPAKSGGNWQGKPYLSLSEADACKREYFITTQHADGLVSQESREQVILRRHMGSKD